MMKIFGVYQRIIQKLIVSLIMEVKIQIPDNCELIKDGDTYIVKEKKNDKPRIWEEFCEKYPIKKGEAYIDSLSNIIVAKSDFECRKELTNQTGVLQKKKQKHS